MEIAFLILYILPMILVVSLEIYGIRQSWKIHKYTNFSEIKGVLMGFIPLISVIYLCVVIEDEYSRKWQFKVFFDKRGKS